MSLEAEAVLAAVKRDESIRTKDLRTSGFIPAVIYSKGKESIDIQIEYQAFRKAFRKTGTSTVLDIQLDGKDYMTLVHDIQYHPVSGNYIHLDLYELTEGEKVTTTVDVVVEGLAPAVKLKGAQLIIPTTHIEVRCLPRDLFHNVTVNVSELAEYNEYIRVSDLPEATSDTIEILTDHSVVLANTAPPKGGTDEEEDEAAAAPAAA